MADFTVDELRERVGRLQGYLREKEIALAILNQNSDIYYYTGSIQPLYLLVPASGEPLLMARKSLSRIQNEAPHLNLEAFYGTKDLAGIIKRFQATPAKRIGLTADTASYATVSRWQQLFGGAEIFDLSFDIRVLRLVKSRAEIAIQAKAGEVMAHLPELVKTSFKPGISELELSAVIENYFRLNGHGILVRCRKEGIECLGVCSAGVNTLTSTKFDGVCAGVGVSAAIPYGAGFDPIPRDAPVTLDYCFNLNGYHVDQTRMFCWGRPVSRVTEAYQAMLQVEKSIMEDLKPGTLWHEVYDHAATLAAELGYETEFMGCGAEKVRFVGHGVGLELDDPPFLAPKMEYPLAAGMVVAVEPKVALAGIGVVGIEDTLVITDSGCEFLTKCSREFFEVE